MSAQLLSTLRKPLIIPFHIKAKHYFPELHWRDVGWYGSSSEMGKGAKSRGLPCNPRIVVNKIMDNNNIKNSELIITTS
jgi:hypothetical protein